MTAKTTDRLTEAERAEFRRAIAEGTAIRRHLAVKAFAELDRLSPDYQNEPEGRTSADVND